MDTKTITMSLSLFNVFPYCSYQFLLIYESCFYHAFMHIETIKMSISLFNVFLYCTYSFINPASMHMETITMSISLFNVYKCTSSYIERVSSPDRP